MIDGRYSTPRQRSRKSVVLSRTITDAMLIQIKSVDRLGVIRNEINDARKIARAQLGHLRPHLARIKAFRVRGYPSTSFELTFTDEAGSHYYRDIARCTICPRRWGEHSPWEKAPRNVDQPHDYGHD